MNILHYIAGLALGASFLILISKLMRYGLNRLVLPSEMTPRAPAEYAPDPRTFSEALWVVNGRTYRLWWKANPMMLIGHTAYHLGLFMAVGVYSTIALLTLSQLEAYSFAGWVVRICDWTQHKASIFGGSGWQYAIGQAADTVFLAGLLMACYGISTPFVMSFLKKRGATRPVDKAMAAAGITKIPGLKTKSSALGYQRKAIGLLVLMMDWLMLFTFLFPASARYTCYVHLTFTFTIVVLLPSSFLFHEIYRLRMWSAVKRIRDGRTA